MKGVLLKCLPKIARNSKEKLKIICEIRKIILDAINAGESKPTRIQYIAMVSPLVLTRYMTSFIKQNLIEEKSDIKGSTKKRYFITEKGKDYLRVINSMDTLISF